MARWVLGRLVMAAMVAITVSIISFALLRLSGDLASSLAGPNAQPEDIAKARHLYGLDRPITVQYAAWAGGVLQGDLGQSLFTNEPVASLIEERVGTTIHLALSALVVALALGIPFGVLAAARPNSWTDRSMLGLSIAGQAIPSFWLGLMLIIFFGVQLRILPISGADGWLNYIMPVMVLATSVMPSIMRITRTGMIDVLESDFVRTAAAKGMTPSQVLFKHALRNAVLPVVSLTAVILGNLLGGSVVVETVFGMNGIGALAFQSIQTQDFPVVQAIVILVAWVYILLTLSADLINAQLDPRLHRG